MAGAPAPQAPPNNAGCFAAPHGLQTMSANLPETVSCFCSSPAFLQAVYTKVVIVSHFNDLASVQHLRKATYDVQHLGCGRSPFQLWLAAFEQ
jgi:hypothetical protein